MIKAQFRTLLICTEAITWRQFYVFLEDFTLTIADPINEVNQSINQSINQSTSQSIDLYSFSQI